MRQNIWNRRHQNKLHTTLIATAFLELISLHLSPQILGALMKALTPIRVLSTLMFKSKLELLAIAIKL
jgi:hypothetical protein